MNKVLLAWLLGVAVALSSRGQNFTNLDFESARVIIIIGPGFPPKIDISNAVPGWSVSNLGNKIPWVDYNLLAPFGSEGSNQWVLDGHFSFYLGSGENTISQTGLVPSGAESLLFDATSSSVLVSLGGQNLSFMAISNAVNASGLGYTVYGANISGFAGQVETLTFFGNNQNANNNGGVGLDDIQFSPEAVPEPSAISFLCLGSGVLFYVRKRRRQLTQSANPAHNRLAG
jgi:hypothetical protein